MADATSTTETAAVETSDDSTTTAPATEATTATEAPAVADGEKALGDAGKKALDAMKAERNAARDAQKKLEADFAALQAKVDGKEAEFAAQQEVQRVKDEALSLANARIVGAELRAAAKGKITDEALADLSLYIKPSEFEVGPDGEVDDSAISAAVDDLIARKPYLAAQSKRFQGSADGGARNDAAKVGQLTEADVKRLSAEGKHEEIVKAREEGRLRDYLES